MFRGLDYFITNAELNNIYDPDMYKVFIGFTGASKEDIEIRGSILYIRTTDRVFYRIAKFLKEHTIVMI
jgi:hypothetical protein